MASKCRGFQICYENAIITAWEPQLWECLYTVSLMDGLTGIRMLDVVPEPESVHDVIQVVREEVE